MNKALYIYETRGLEVLRDGPSVIVREPQRADRRIPARIVSSVVVVGNVVMDTATVALFAEHGIPVTFICKKGKAIAVALPYEYKLPRHHPKQRIFAESEENRRMFVRWLRTNIKRLTMICVHNLIGARNNAQTSRTDAPGVVDYAYLIKQLERTLPAQSRIVREVIDHLFQETIISVLLANGLDPHVGIVHRNKNYGLVEDMRDFFRPEADYQAVCFFQEFDGQPWFETDEDGVYSLGRDGLYQIIRRFESRRESILYVSERLTEQMLKMFGSRSG